MTKIVLYLLLGWMIIECILFNYSYASFQVLDHKIAVGRRSRGKAIVTQGGYSRVRLCFCVFLLSPMFFSLYFCLFGQTTYQYAALFNERCLRGKREKERVGLGLALSLPCPSLLQNRLGIFFLIFYPIFLSSLRYL